MAAAHKKSPATLSFFRFCLEMLVFLFFSIETLVTAFVRAFWQPATWWAGPRIYHKWRVYGLLHAMCVAMFNAIFCKTLVQAIWVYFCSYLHDYTG